MIKNYLEVILLMCNNPCEVEYTDEFGLWWNSLTEAEQKSVATSVRLLEMFGAQLTFPYCSGVNASKHKHMRELRVQHQGKPYRILYAFDPLRKAILLIGGNKTGDNRWYEKFISIADKLYDQHLAEVLNQKQGE